jgi:hypothetical protein
MTVWDVLNDLCMTNDLGATVCDDMSEEVLQVHTTYMGFLQLAVDNAISIFHFLHCHTRYTLILLRHISRRAPQSVPETYVMPTSLPPGQNQLFCCPLFDAEETQILACLHASRLVQHHHA